MDTGTQLRDARKQRGMTLDVVAASTKVSRHTLELIDSNQFGRLPGGILTRGYLRAYAAAVGLDPERIVADYREQWFGEAGEALPIAAPPPVEEESRFGRRRIVELVLIAAVAGAVFAQVRQSSERPRRVAPAASAPALAPPAAAPPEASRTERAVVAVASVPAEAAPGIRVELRPEGPCWVSAAADDRPVFEQLLQSGEQAVVRARTALVLRVGEPEACRYWLNGTPGRQLGPAGIPVTVRITEDNYETFLADRPAPERQGSGGGIVLDASRRAGGLS